MYDTFFQKRYCYLYKGVLSDNQYGEIMNSQDKQALIKQLSPITQYLIEEATKEGLISLEEEYYPNVDNKSV